MAAAGCPVSGVGPDVAGVGLIFSLDFDSLHGRCALCRCSLIEMSRHVIRSGVNHFRWSILASYGFALWFCALSGSADAGVAYRRRLSHSLLVLLRRLSRSFWFCGCRGCVPAKATALVVGIAEAPFVPGEDLIGLRKYVDCMEPKLDYALLCLQDCCYTCILYGQVEYGMELVGDYGLYGRRAAEQDAAHFSPIVSVLTRYSTTPCRLRSCSIEGIPA